MEHKQDMVLQMNGPSKTFPRNGDIHYMKTTLRILVVVVTCAFLSNGCLMPPVLYKKVEMYGQVLDQNGKPVSDAPLQCVWSPIRFLTYVSPMASMYTTPQYKENFVSDSNGNWRIAQRKVQGEMCVQIRKEDNYLVPGFSIIPGKQWIVSLDTNPNHINCPTNPFTIWVNVATNLQTKAATEQIPVTKTYGGIIDISARLADDEPPPLNGEKFEPLLVIRTQQEYADLLRRIPIEGISQGEPAAKNEDSLLQKPQIDFTNKMLVVVVRASMDAPLIRTIIRKDGMFVIETELSDNSLPRPYGTGTYRAVLIPFSRDKVIVQITERKKREDELRRRDAKVER
jgi:hypothetical protein